MCFLQGYLKPKLLIHGGKEKEVHETEILVSVASFCKCWKSSSIKHAGCRKDLGLSIKIMRKFDMG